ncbi:hypothetical protein [Nonomuraea africana]|uniref:Heme-degrading monooxygenase HmoA n=1 Tax=Nonomuraea africana TaxID=46171 RepID=A0ABR9KGQ9_9ACTN|nr:hypothetical protein [Nonomuraea africana]MBE1561202.1 heme-degrading monooxygenase HmoA [Nonomuraea africana]
MSTYTGPADRIDDAIRGFERSRELVTGMDGIVHAYMLVDRSSGKVMTISLWRDERALQSSADRAAKVREEAAAAVGGTVESVESYEVALQVP